MTDVLSVENLHVHIKTSTGLIKAVNGVTLSQSESQIYCLLGENGSGKTTLALAIIGLLPESASVVSGSIRVNDIDILNANDASLNSIRGKEISMVFQDARAALNPVLTVGKQLQEAISAHRHVPKRIAEIDSQEILYALGLPNPRSILNQYPFDLSGGMCQRVMLAIALINRPKLLIADESTSALDVTLQAELMERLKLLSQDFGTAILFISHDLGVVANMAHHVGVMYAGTLVESAEVMELFGQPRHPYTLSMMQASPRLDNPDKTLTSLRGVSPDMSDLPTGCPFLPRCNKATLTCRSSSRPLLNDIGRDHLVACYNPVSY
mgnify:CR=1 FL=1